MSHRPLALIILAIVAGMVGSFGMPSFSTALFTSRSSTTASVSAAPDWTPPTVSVTSPGVSVAGTVTIAATAADPETGVQSVTIQVQPVGGATWTTLCTDTTSPYSCAWTTTTMTDGTYDIRGRATDGAGYTTTSTSVRTTVANNVLVVLAPPDDVIRGTVPLQATLYNTATLTYTVRIQIAPTGTTSWTTICNNLAAPYTCSWNTTTAANADYDLRAVAISGSTTHTSATVAEILVDNQAPTVTMTDPGTPLSGSRIFAATATDAHSGLAQVVIQSAPTGSSTFSTLCTITVEPFSCRVDTASLADGSYSFRAVATDVAGNVTASAVVANRFVDNTVSSVSLGDVPAYLGGTFVINATGSSTAGVTSIRIQYAPAGTTGWTDICTDTTSPYACAWDTTRVTDGLYDLRAVMVDGSGGQTTSAVVTARRVDNSPLRAVDVQTGNGGGTAGRLDVGDSVTLTFSEQVAPASVTSGWTGAALAVNLRVRDGNLVGLTNKGDTLDVLRTGSSVNLGSVNLREDYVKGGKTATFNATMTATTVTVNGVPATQVTLTLGSLASGGGLRTVSTATAVVWSPSGAVLDLFGRACSTAPATESGALDREF
jgi:hypothetical protein